MKRLLILGLALGIVACSPDIPTGTNNAGQFIEAEFDPANSVIPLPNDLLFLNQSTGQIGTTLNAPTTGSSAAQNEFNATYLNLLDGFPMESTASVLFSQPINLSSVKLFGSPGQNLIVFDITNQAAPLPVTALTVTTSPAPNGAQSLNFIPPSGYWTRGHRYGVLIVGGADGGIQGANAGQTVTGSPTWSLVSGNVPVLVCDSGGNNCRPGSSVIPATGTSPQDQYDSQLQAARQLNLLQQNYAPFIAQATAAGLSVANIAIGWTFTITSQAEVTFDPANSIIPFPNDVLNPTQGQVALPVPPDAGALTALYTGLNTLDGFSTSAPVVSENGSGTGPLIQGVVDPTTVVLGVTGTMNLVQAAPGRGAAPTTDGGVIRAHACLNCPGITMNLPDGGPVRLADGGVKPDTLAIVPDIPLTERTTYAAYITTDLKDTTNTNVIPSPAFALVRSSAPLFENGQSTVSLLTNDQAQQLEPLRAALAPLFDGLAAQGLPRSKVALGWAFTTETTVGALSQLHAIPSSPQAAAVPAVPLWVQEIPAPAGVPTTGVGKWYIGEIVDIFLLTSSTGTLNPSAPATPKMQFVMSVPAAPAGASGYAVSLFGHGFTRTRDDGFGMSAGLAAANNVMIAIDEPWHGERNTCTGFGALLAQGGVPAGLATDNAACVPPSGQTFAVGCSAQTGRCLSADRSSPVACTYSAPDADKICLTQIPSQGHCAPDNRCENATFGTTFAPGPGISVPISGWKFVNLNNFFATRDNIRQQVVSNAQLTRVLSTTTAGNIGQQAGGIALNPAAINYTGQSLGGILGMNTSAISPEIKNAALNVPGGHLTQLILTSPNPSFVALTAGLQAGLAAEGIATFSPDYDTFIATIQWILDPGDPINSAPYLLRNAGLTLPNGGSTRRGYVQWIAQDQTVPNPTTAALIQSVVGDPSASGVLLHPAGSSFWANQYPSSGTLANNHGFLLGTAGAATAQQAQGQIATFVAGGAPF